MRKLRLNRAVNQLENIVSVREYSSRSKEAISSVVKHENRPETSMKKRVPRINQLGVQMLSPSLHSQIFSKENSPQNDHNEINIKKSINHLKHHGLWGKETSLMADVDFKLPKLHGKNLDEHFYEIAKNQSQKYLKLGMELVNNGLPTLPKKWNYQEGWTKYLPNGKYEKVDFPDEDGLVFDIEVCLSDGNLPTLATASSTKFWYSWCSSRLTENNLESVNRVTTCNLIPLETKNDECKPPCNETWKEKLVIGHNVSFDRARIKEQYLLKGPKTRFLDTMSLHIATAGITSFQRSLMLTEGTNSTRKDVEEAKSKLRGPLSKDWMKMSSLNSLKDVHQLHCGGDKLEKEARNIFIDGDMDEVRQNFQFLMTYCAKDVIATHEVLQKLLPEFLDRFPHPATFAGMLEMSVAYLPVNKNWENYVEKTQKTFNDLEDEVKVLLMQLANDACRLLNDEKFKTDPWLWSLDWSTQKTKYKKTKPKKSDDEVSSEDAKYLCKRQPFLPGYPAWYRKLISRTEPDESKLNPGKPLISVQMRVVPLLLRLTWDGYTLYYDKTHGWGYLTPLNPELRPKPTQDNPNPGSISIDQLWEQLEKGIGDPVELSQLFLEIVRKKEKKLKPLLKTDKIDVGVPEYLFTRLPHKNGPGNRVGNPLAKDFLSKIEDGTLKAQSGVEAELVLKLGKKTSYWRNACKRISSQITVWLNNTELPPKINETNHRHQDDHLYGAILPQIVTAGTVTRRAVEPTWLTASNAYPDRVGSELKSMIQVPPGYKFVGADVDSQELWIAAILGDKYFAGIHGCTAIGWMTLQGKKSDGTDMHSRTAATVGISRDHAKVMNYGRIYGAGLPFAQQLMMQFNHRLTADEAKVKAQAMFAATKGVKGFILNSTGKDLYKKLNGVESDDEIILTKGEIIQLLMDTQCPLQFYDVVDKPIWIGGTESAMFNQLEKIAQSPEPATPVLGCRISRALEPAFVKNNFMTSRVNWVVQSSAVDYLHLMLVCMRWLCDTYDIDARFSISIHDEVRYLVNEDDALRAALALQITNLLTRALFAIKLGMNDLPQSVAFFSAVDIDTVLRKEVTMDCVTPSNPNGLSKGLGIPPGQALDIYTILEKTDGNLNK